MGSIMEQSANDPERVKKWNCIYPLYFDASRSLTQGRRVSKSQAVKKPTCQHLFLACESLGLPIALEEGKRHPREPFVMGRLRVQLYDDEGRNPLRSDIPNVHSLIGWIANRLPDALSKIPTKDDSTIQRTVINPIARMEAAPGVTLVPRSKKKSRK